MSIKEIYQIYPPRRVWRTFWLKLARLPLFHVVKILFLKLGGVHVHNTALIYGDVSFDTVNPQGIYIGSGVRITSGTKILTHYIDPSQPGVNFNYGEVHIEDEVFIGVNTCICSPVTIGRGAIVGAGSIVTKNIPPFQVWAGNPAHYIKERNH